MSSSPINITIVQTGVQGSSGAQLSVGGQISSAPSNIPGIGYTDVFATMLLLLVGQTAGTFQAFSQASETAAPVIQPFAGASGTLALPSGQAVTITNSSPYSVLFAIGTATAQVSSPAPAIINPGGSVSFTFNSTATSIPVTGGAANPTNAQPGSGTPVPTTPVASGKSKTLSIILIVAAIVVVIAAIAAVIAKLQK